MVNNVTGPSSALTSFLREHGITARPSYARRTDNQNAAAAPDAQATTNTSGTSSNNAVPSTSRSNPTGYRSDDLDGTEAEGEPAPKKRKLTKAAAAKLKAKEKAKRKKAGLGSDAEEDNEEEDEYKALSKGHGINGATGPLPPIGSFEECAKCETEFTVTRYTMAAVPPPGFLCHDCVKASGMDPFKKKASGPRKRKNPAEQRKVVNFEAAPSVPSLAGICIQIISNHIEDVEALGDIGSTNLNNISRIVAKNRSLTASNAQLFYDVSNTQLRIYDATNLEPDALCTLASLNPNLEELKLDFCGRMDNSTISHWAQHFLHLRRVDLLGPFLVRPEGWKSFLQERGAQLDAFLITQSPRFDQTCIDLLASSCQSLKDLRLSQIGKMTDEFLPVIATLQNLTSIDLSDPAQSLGDEALIDLLSHIGSKLTILNLSGNTRLTDDLLLKGIKPHTKLLSELVLCNIPLLTDKGVAKFFSSYGRHPPLQKIIMSRNHTLSTDALAALIRHSGRAVTELDINSWKETSEESLKMIPEYLKCLKELDVGWCREVDNFIIKEILEECHSLEMIKVYGCNKLTEACPLKRGVSITGIETQLYG